MTEQSVNPFTIIGIGPATPMIEASEAKDDAVFEGRIDAGKADHAFRILSDPRLRLTAEMAWPLDGGDLADPALAQRLDRGATSFDGTAAPFACALAVTRAVANGQVPVNAGVITELDLRWGSVRAETLARLIDTARHTAGVPATSVAAVTDALSEVREMSVREVLKSMGHPAKAGPILAAAVEQAIRREAPGRFAEVLVARHQADSHEVLALIEQEIERLKATIRSAPETAKATLPALKAALQRWGDITRPTQLLEQFRGREDERSLALGMGLRGFAVAMTNDHAQPDFSAAVVNALLETFPQLDGLVATLNGDREALVPLLRAQMAGRKRDTKVGSPPPRAAPAPTPRASSTARPTGRETDAGNSRVARWLVVALIMGALYVWANLPRDLSSGETERATTNASALGSAMPSVGRDQALSAEEINYCLHADSLIESIQRMDLTNAMIDRSNAMVDDYNSRCSHFRYRQSDMIRARAAQDPARIAEEARDMVAAWLGQETPSAPMVWSSPQPVESEPSTLFPATPAPAAAEAPIPVPQSNGPSVETIRTCLQRQRFIQLVQSSVKADKADRLIPIIAAHRAACDDITSSPDLALAESTVDLSGAYRDAQQFLESLGYDAPAVGATSGDPLAAALRNAGAPPRDDLPEPFDLRDPEAARAVQARLLELGHLAGSGVDGHFGRGSVNALERFKAERGLPVNDVWDYATQQELFR